MGLNLVFKLIMNTEYVMEPVYEELEWPEDQDPKKVEVFIERVLVMFFNKVEETFGNQGCFFTLTIHPPRNIDKLIEKIESKKNNFVISEVRYGYKDRGWGIVFKEKKLLELLLPLFFLHGAENFMIAALETSIGHNNDFALSDNLNILFFDNSKKDFNSCNLYFECGCLVE